MIRNFKKTKCANIYRIFQCMRFLQLFSLALLRKNLKLIEVVLFFRDKKSTFCNKKRKWHAINAASSWPVGSSNSWNRFGITTQFDKFDFFHRCSFIRIPFSNWEKQLLFKFWILRMGKTALMQRSHSIAIVYREKNLEQPNKTWNNKINFLQQGCQFKGFYPHI